MDDNKDLCIPDTKNKEIKRRKIEETNEIITTDENDRENTYNFCVLKK